MRLSLPPFRVVNGYLMRKITQPRTLVHHNRELAVYEKRLAAADVKCYIEWRFRKFRGLLKGEGDEGRL
jgi:hypothetical protein